MYIYINIYADTVETVEIYKSRIYCLNKHETWGTGRCTSLPPWNSAIAANEDKNQQSPSLRCCSEPQEAGMQSPTSI